MKMAGVISESGATGIEVPRKSKEICWETVEFLLHEAFLELADIGARLEKARTGVAPQGWKRRLKGEDRLSEEALKHSLSQAYHNLNFAWNARYCKPEEMDRDYAKKCRFPAIFTRNWRRFGGDGNAR